MTLGSEEAIEGTLERTSIAIYPKNPKKYFYYVLEMNPKKNNGNASYSTEEGSTFTCPPRMNAFLIGYKGDGSKNTFCATLK